MPIRRGCSDGEFTLGSVTEFLSLSCAEGQRAGSPPNSSGRWGAGLLARCWSLSADNSSVERSGSGATLKMLLIRLPSTHQRALGCIARVENTPRYDVRHYFHVGVFGSFGRQRALPPLVYPAAPGDCAPLPVAGPGVSSPSCPSVSSHTATAIPVRLAPDPALRLTLLRHHRGTAAAPGRGSPCTPPDSSPLCGCALPASGVTPPSSPAKTPQTAASTRWRSGWPTGWTRSRGRECARIGGHSLRCAPHTPQAETLPRGRPCIRSRTMVGAGHFKARALFMSLEAPASEPDDL